MIEDKDKEMKVREVAFEDLTQDEGFSAYGYVRLKVQRGDEILAIKLRIISIPQEELMKLRKQSPRPPIKPQMDPVSKQRIMLADPSDEGYQVKLEAYQIMLTREAVGRGIGVPLFLDGQPASTPEEKYKALEARGLTSSHFTELAGAILRLTDWTETERENHL